MRKDSIFLAAFILISCMLLPADGFSQEQLQCSDTHVDVHFFYSTGCPHCADVKPLLKEISSDKDTYPDIEVHEHEIHTSESYKLFTTACKKLNISSRGVPLIVVGDTYYQGDRQILDNLEKRLTQDLKDDDYGCILACSNNDIQNITIEDDSNRDLDLTLPVIVASGLLDGINPCAFAVLIFLASTLIMIGDRKKMLLIGSIYIASVYATYFVAGLGLLTAVQYSGMTSAIYNIAAIIAILFGLFNIRAFFSNDNDSMLKIPEDKKKTISRFAKKGSIPSALILGILVSMFELPCTGAVYFAIIGLLSSSVTQMEAIPYLLIYNLAFILPLILLLAAIYRGTRPETIEKWRKKDKKWMRLSMGIIMLALGLGMLLGFL